MFNRKDPRDFGIAIRKTKEQIEDERERRLNRRFAVLAGSMAFLLMAVGVLSEDIGLSSACFVVAFVLVVASVLVAAES